MNTDDMQVEDLDETNHDATAETSPATPAKTYIDPDIYRQKEILRERLKKASVGHVPWFPTWEMDEINKEIEEFDRYESEARRVRSRRDQHCAKNLWLLNRQIEWQQMVEAGHTRGVDEEEFFRVPDYLEPR